jgi:hypothetical protein
MRSIKNRHRSIAIDALDMPDLDNQLSDGGNVVHWVHSTPQEHHFPASDTHFC